MSHSNFATVPTRIWGFIDCQSIDRLCRNMMDMCYLTLDLKQRGVSLIFLKENICFSANENNPLQ
ncbi:resolvase-like protein [Providencia alcalifaciens]|uniref:Resolvase-like protein n=1 Tax=Providencia alcalifaciens TaxID=126385 RepID=A0A4R3NEW8_9GAMM|nr:resolvase-like protein [Providencia alcalifaciens]